MPAGARSRATRGRRRAKSPGSDTALSLLGQINTICATCEDTLNELSDSYSFEVRPELVVKLRKRCVTELTALGYSSQPPCRTPWVTLGARYEAQAGRTELVAKQGLRDLPLWKLVRRVVVAPERGDLRIHSSRLSLGIFGVEAVYTHDLGSGTPGLSWRISSAWDAGLTHVGRKQRLPAPFPATLKPSARWDVATLKPPDLNGRMGAGASGLALELGKFHCSLPRCQLAVEL